MLKAVSACNSKHHSGLYRIIGKLLLHNRIHGLELINRLQTHVILIIA